MADYYKLVENCERVFSNEEKMRVVMAYPFLSAFDKIIGQNLLFIRLADEVGEAPDPTHSKNLEKICKYLEPGNDEKRNCSRLVLTHLQNNIIKVGHTGIVHELEHILLPSFILMYQTTATLFDSLEKFAPSHYLTEAKIAIQKIFEFLITPDDGLFFASPDTFAEEVKYAFSEFFRNCEANVRSLRETYFSPVPQIKKEINKLDKSVRSLEKKANGILYEVSEDHAFGKALSTADQMDALRETMLQDAIRLIGEGDETVMRRAARQIVEKYATKRGGYKGESGVNALSEQIRRNLKKRGIQTDR